MEAAAASAMDFHTLSRRELQALCKRNGVRANMTNAAMADALQGLTSVDGIDEIGTTLCLPTPGRSTMKSAAKANAMAVAGEEQQHGSPLPRGRRVSVMSPAAFRMDVEEGDDELKRDLVKEIVKTPGVALRSTSRRARATPAPLPTPVTLRRSQRTAARKAAVPVEVESCVEEMSTAKRATRRASVRSKMILDLDQEEEVAVVATKEQQEEPKDVAPDVKCDDPAEEEAEVTKLLEGNNKEKEQEEADSSDAANGSALLSENGCDNLKVEEMLAVEQDTTGPQDGTVEEQELISVQKSASLARMDDSPILGVLSKDEATESVIEIAQDASVENDEGIAEEWSPVNNMIVETDPDVEDKVETISEVAVKVDGFTVTGETVYSPKEIVPTATKEDETNEEDLTEEKVGSADEMRQAELTEEETSDELDEDEEWALDDDEASDSTDEIEEGDCIEVRTNFNNVNEELVQMMQGTAIAVEDSEDSVAEVSEDSVEDVSEDGLADEEEVSEDGSADEEEASEDGSASEEASEDGSADEEVSEEDDFTSDLPPEFDNIVVFSDAETESSTASPVKENQVAIASASKTSVKSMNDSAICVTNNEEVTEEKDVIEEAMKEVGNNVDTIVKSLHECTIKERTQQAEEEKLNIKVDAVGQKGKQMEDYNTMSMRKLKATLKNHLSSKQGKKEAEAKRLPLEEVDDINACVDC